MKCKYKKFLKAAYIDYEEDYCSNAVLRSSRPPQSEILAPATFDVTLNYADGYYWATFYTSMANYQASDGVRVYKVNLNGSQFTSINVEDGIINKRQGVMLRSSTSSITLTKTYSKSSDDYSNNSLIGTDYEITNPGHAYVLGYKSSHGIAFYRLSSTGKIKANRAYLIVEDTYLTQWKIVGNSEVHTDEYLTQWKVSGNSVVDNNTILSCGDYSDVDGKYHVKISNGVNVFDIALTEPLRKVNNVADTIEFPSETEGKALVTRNLNTNHYDSLTASKMDSENKSCNLSQALPVNSFNYTESVDTNIIFLCNKLNSYSLYYGRKADLGIIPFYRGLFIRNASIEQTEEAYQEYLNGLGAIDVIYKLATPTTELVDVSPFPVSSTDTYTSANVVPYSAFEHTENKEIWSCGELVTNSITLFDGTQELSEGWVPSSGAYPTIESSCPNAAYYVMDVKTGYVITCSNGGNTRLRLIANGSVVCNISANVNNTYIKVSSDYTSSGAGNITVKQDCQIAILIINPQQSYEGAVIATESKYHILVQPLGGSVADIALTEPLRKVNDVADTIEFPSETEGKALVTRYLVSGDLGNLNFLQANTNTTDVKRYRAAVQDISTAASSKILTAIYNVTSSTYSCVEGINASGGVVYIYDANYNQVGDTTAFINHVRGNELIYELATPTTELVDAPQIEEAESYSMVISQGAKAVEWSSFETE